MFTMISSDGTQQDASYLFIKNSGTDSRLDYYTFNPKKFDSEKCHIFFLSDFFKKNLVVTSLKHMVFTPGSPLNKEFKTEIIKCGEMKLTWCSFPKKYRGGCERAAKLFEITMRPISGSCVGTQTFLLHFPCFHPTLFKLEGEQMLFQSETEISKFKRDREDIEWIGKSLDRLGVD